MACAPPFRFDKGGDCHAGNVEHVADAYLLQRRRLLVPQAPETAIDYDKGDECGEKGEDYDGARRKLKIAAEVAVGGQGLENGEAELDANGSA